MDQGFGLPVPVFLRVAICEIRATVEECSTDEFEAARSDEISWNFNESGQFSTSSANHAQFIGAISTNLNEIIWSA
jgi:hypothetical protein